MALGLAITALAANQKPSPAPHDRIQRKLLVISIDGLDARFLKDADRMHLKIPALRRMIAQGAMADGVIGVTPTLTWPSYASLVTGVPPAVHGITTNGPPDKPGQGWWSVASLKTQTLWQAAAAKQLKTALLFWPTSVGARVDFDCPEFWETHDSPEISFAPIADKCTSGLVERIASVYPSFTKSLWTDRTGMEAASYLEQYEQPDLTMVHIADLDVEQRETGALSLYSRDLLESDDELIGSALKTLPPHTVVAIISDHGFETADHVVRPKVMLKQAKVRGSVQVRYGLIGTSEANVAALLRKEIGNRKSGISREVPMSEVRAFAPQLKQWTAAFDTLPNYVASEEERGAAVGLGSHKGVNDFWPTRPAYRASFVLWGEGVKAGTRWGEISMLDVAPTLADVLRVKLPAAKGISHWK